MSEQEDFEFRLRMEREAGAGPAVADPPQTTMADRMAGSWGARVLQGAASPVLAGVQMLGGEKGREMVAELDAMKKRGMAAEGKDGFDWYGLLGSMLPGTAITKGATAIMPVAKTLGGKILQGGAIGAATAAAQPVAPSPDFWSDKAAQVGVGGTLGAVIPAVGSAITSMRGTPTMNPTQAATLQEGQQAGYVVPPSTVNPSFLNNRMESLAGKAAVGQEAAKRNQEITNALAVKELGLPKGTPLTERALTNFREQAAQPYRDVSALAPSRLEGMKVKTIESRQSLPGPAMGVKVKEVRGKPQDIFGLKSEEVRDEAGNLLGMRVGTSSRTDAPLESVKTSVTSRGQDIPGPLEGLKVSVRETRSGDLVGQLKDARFNANNYYKHYSQSADPESLKKAQQFSAQVKEIEAKLDDIAGKAGRPELIKALAEARTKIAKSYDVERALNLGSGDISAAIIGRQLDKAGVAGKSGELATIGKMAEAFPSVMREGSRVPSPGVSGTDAAAGAILGTLGYGAGGPAGLLAAGLPLLRGPARNLVLSPGYQQFATQGLSPQRQAMIDALMRQGAGAAGTGTGRMMQ